VSNQICGNMKSTFILIVSIILIYSCNNKRDIVVNQKIKIEFQHFEGCPNGPKLLKNLKDAMIGYEDKIDFSEQIIDSPELAKKFNFRGSPTLLIDGKDMDGMETPENPSLACRFYPNGLPTADSIRLKIQKIIQN